MTQPNDSYSIAKFFTYYSLFGFVAGIFYYLAFFINTGINIEFFPITYLDLLVSFRRWGMVILLYAIMLQVFFKIQARNKSCKALLGILENNARKLEWIIAFLFWFGFIITGFFGISKISYIANLQVLLRDSSFWTYFDIMLLLFILLYLCAIAPLYKMNFHITIPSTFLLFITTILMCFLLGVIDGQKVLCNDHLVSFSFPNGKIIEANLLISLDKGFFVKDSDRIIFIPFSAVNGVRM